MTMRERILAVLHGREVDRVPFVQYEGTGGPTEEIWSAVGRQNMGILRWSAVHRAEHPDCRWTSRRTERNGLRGVLNTLTTPAGELTEEKLCQPSLGAEATRKHFVTRPEDYCVLAAYLRDTVICEDTARFLADDEHVGQDGLAHVSVDRTPFQQLWIQWVSIEDLSLHLVDCPEPVEECIELMARNLRAQFEIVRRAPVPYVVFPDNITAPVIGERYFRRHCVPFYDELAGMLAERDVPVFVHMDGHLKPLWRAIGGSGVRGIDSLSPPPDNDTSVAQALSMWPQMRLFVNFPSSVHVAPPEKVYARAQQILTEGGNSGRIQIQVSEDVPPGVWRTSFPQIIRAIRDFRVPPP
jgi:hypothetical protein